MAHSLSPHEKEAIDSILNEAAIKFAPDLTMPVSLQALDEKSKQLWGDDWDETVGKTPKANTVLTTKNKPFSQIIKERNPSLFKTAQFDSNSDNDDDDIEPNYSPALITPKQTTQIKTSKYTDDLELTPYRTNNENDSDIENESDDNSPIIDKRSTSKNTRTHSKISSKDQDFASKVLKKAKESKLLSSFKTDNYDDSPSSYDRKELLRPKSTHRSQAPVERTKLTTHTVSKKKGPSLYQRSLKKEQIIESTYDRCDIARLRQDNIEAKKTIARLQAALDKANIENERLRKSLQESERIRMKQKTQISYILSEK